MSADILALKRMLAERAGEVAEYLLPRGMLDTREWCCGSVGGEPGKSLKVCVAGAKAGVWTDFAAGGGGGDLIDLWALVKHRTLPEALADIRDWLGLESTAFDKPSKAWRRPDRPHCTAPKSAVLDYLTVNRKLSRESISVYRVGEDGRVMIFPLLDPDGTLLNIKRRSIDREPGKQPKTWAEAECEPVLFGWQAIASGARDVMICEGEIDALTWFDYGYPALSVPFGGGKGAKQRWIECEYDRLLRFETIYLAMDMDEEGDLAVQEIVNRLGRHRCRRVKLPHKDANDCLLAGVTTAEITRLLAASEHLDPAELRNAGSYAAKVEGLFWPTGDVEPGYCLPFEKLRDRLRFRAGEVTIWTGATGSGKSQMLSHACVAWGEQGARLCIASLEMTPAQLLKRMVKQAGNVDRPTPEFIHAIMGWLNERVWLASIVGKSVVTKLLEIFEYARCKYGCDVFVIDSLMRLGVGAEDYEGQEKAVFEIVNWAVERNVHCHLVAHARKADKAGSGIAESEDIKGTSEIAANAFNILSVWRNRKLEQDLIETADRVAKGDRSAEAEMRELEDRPTVIMNLAKQRNGDWEGKSGLWFNVSTYQYRGSHDGKYGRSFVTLQDTRDPGRSIRDPWEMDQPEPDADAVSL